MSLKDYIFKPYYNKEESDIAKEFYYPCMSSSTRYDRATGYFSSTVYLLSWRYLKQFVHNDGRMRILCSPYISKVDQDAIEEGLMGKNSKDIYDKLFNEFNQIFQKDTLSAPERVLACLISNGVIEIKIAVGRQDINRLFHDKQGIFFDGNNNVAFRGSVNETYKGLSDDGNFESFDVFTSWGSESDLIRLKGIEETFNKVWNNESSSIRSIDLPSSIKSIIKKHAIKESNWVEAIEEISSTINKSIEWTADKNLSGKRPKEHQLNALENWVKAGKKGILEHATGSGKTFTALCAIRKELENYNPVIILVPSVGLLEQWEIEMNHVFTDLDVNYLICGGGNNQWKNDSILHTWTSPDIPLKRIILSTMVTASTTEFIEKIIPSNKLMVVADEVHRMGSCGNRVFFKVEAGIKLGLSATPRRYGDYEGTQSIFNYFGDIIQPPFTLKDAIDAGILCKYFYYPEVVSLTQDEQTKWDDLSSEIKVAYARLIGTLKADDVFNNNKIKMLLLKRSSIIKNAFNKISLTKKIISENYKNGDRWIVYCDNQQQLKLVLQELSSLPFRSYEYHSEMEGDRNETLKYFSSIGGIIVSIKCLDEGIDIPSTTHALILASSKNPREFIQRRGRILRKNEGKFFSYLYDAIVLPNKFVENDQDSKIVQAELARAIQFGGWAENPGCITRMKLIASDNNIDLSLFENIGNEDE